MFGKDVYTTDLQKALQTLSLLQPSSPMHYNSSLSPAYTFRFSCL